MSLVKAQVMELVTELRELPEIARVSKMEAIRMLAGEIGALKERRPRVSNEQIVEVLRARGLELSLETFRNYWHRVSKETRSQAPRPQPITPMAAAQRRTSQATTDASVQRADQAEASGQDARSGYFTPTLYDSEV